MNPDVKENEASDVFKAENYNLSKTQIQHSLQVLNCNLGDQIDAQKDVHLLWGTTDERQADKSVDLDPCTTKDEQLVHDMCEASVVSFKDQSKTSSDPSIDDDATILHAGSHHCEFMSAQTEVNIPFKDIFLGENEEKTSF